MLLGNRARISHRSQWSLSIGGPLPGYAQTCNKNPQVEFYVGVVRQMQFAWFTLLK